MPIPPAILLVEDDFALATSLADILEMRGYTVTRAESGEKGVNELNLARVPDCVVMDGNLPGMDGAEAIRIMRQTQFRGPILAISAEDRSDEMLQAGATEFMRKPFDVGLFVKLVEKWLKP